jgi:hypothetical protein
MWPGADVMSRAKLPRKTNPFRENIASCGQVGLPLRSELPRGNVPHVRSVLIVASLTLQNLLLRVNEWFAQST